MLSPPAAAGEKIPLTGHQGQWPPLQPVNTTEESGGAKAQPV